MIADLDRTIRNLLINEMPISDGEIDIKFDQPTRDWSARLTRPTLNFYLYDVRENNTLRQQQWQRANGNGRDHLAWQKRMPYRVDCHYMMTVWAAEAEDEHRLLTRAMLALFRFPILPPEQMLGEMQGQPFEVPAALARHDRLTNPAEVWSAIDNDMRPAISYMVTLALDPWTEVSGPIVRTPILRTGQAHTLPHLPQMVQISERAFIGGVVRQDAQPQVGIEVAIKGTGYLTMTDANGRFRLGALPTGSYTLIAWPPHGKPKQTDIAIPQPSYDIDL